MLKTLTIRNIVLIQNLELEFETGLGVLTGETGSGKSILLDALSLAIGVRADFDLIKTGESQSAVTAEFIVKTDNALLELLRSRGIETEESIILKRVLNKGGSSRAFINDEPVALTFLKKVGAALVELHGQMEFYGLLDSRNHVEFIDSFARIGKEKKQVNSAFLSWKNANESLKRALSKQDDAKRDEEFLRYSVEELVNLDPQPDEENTLSSQREILMSSEKLMEALRDTSLEIEKVNEIDSGLRTALKILERVPEKAAAHIAKIIKAIERAIVEVDDASAELDQVIKNFDEGTNQLEFIEERLFALRGVARKHGTNPADLPELRLGLEKKLMELDYSHENILSLETELEEKKQGYIEKAKVLTHARKVAAETLDKSVSAELPPLKLEAAYFRTRFEDLEEADWGPNGCERLIFEVQTNPNTSLGPLHKIASGGELARLMLALKVVLLDTKSAPTIVFDEVDVGVGGATAAAVGERLAKLSDLCQVLVITHSPQVAARADKHWRISKIEKSVGSKTIAEYLGVKERTEEVARMLAGSHITEEARAAAKQLFLGPKAKNNT